MEVAWSGKGTSLTEAFASSALNATLWGEKTKICFLFCGIYTVFTQHETEKGNIKK